MHSVTMTSTPARGSFSAWDYVVFVLMLLVSAAIGVYYALVRRGQQSPTDFLMGGRSLTAVPMALSLTASFMSAIVVLATPAEVYRYGASFGLFSLSHILVMVISSEVFLPVFYRLGITSTYEYLERRFNRAARLCGTALFILQTVLYTGIVIYAPALALNQVTGIDLWGAVISTGVVCTFYCSVGGLRAVVWTDVFQVGIMMAGFLAVIIQSVLFRGGVSNILNDCAAGGRLNLWDFDPSPFRRHTFWTITFGGAFVWVSVYGINQAQVQRYISCKTMFQAKIAIYVNLLGLWAIMLCAVFAGLCLYSIYKDCDPWTAGQVSAPDQLMPFLVLDILGGHPGLPGLFVAAAYSATLSTVSSSVSALAAVTLEDLVKPYSSMSDQQLSWTSKGLSFLYGAVCIAMAGLASLMGGLLQAAISIFGVVGGPLLGLFTLGILCPFANSTGGLAGLLTGLALSLWVGVGAQLYPPPPESSRPLALHTHGCNATSFNWTLSATQPSMLSVGLQDQTHNRSALADSWYSLSYLYFSPLGTLTAMTVGLGVSLLSGGRHQKLVPDLMLKREDLTCYSIYMFLKERASRRAGELELGGEGENTLGKSNPAFCSMELNVR